MEILPIIAVLIIDTGVMSTPGVPIVYPDKEVGLFHGTQVSMVAAGVPQKSKLCDNVKFFSCNWYPDNLHTCLDYANRYNFDFVNLSIEGDQKDIIEEAYLRSITAYGTIVTVAAGNQRVQDLSFNRHYPASYVYENFFNYRVVTDSRRDYANKGPGLIEDEANWILMNQTGKLEATRGTSFAAPSYLHKLLLNLCSEYSRKDIMCRKTN